MALAIAGLLNYLTQKTMQNDKKLKLVLADGTVLEGKSFGAYTDSYGEVVFNTGMVGYPESLTDPSYKDQILVLTYPLVGNYGVPDWEKDANGLLKNFESEKIHVKGLIVSDYSENYNHHAAVESLSEWLEREGIPAITGIDTRALTKKLREKGSMLGKITTQDENADKIEFDDPNKRNLVPLVSIPEPIEYGSGDKTILLVDSGVKLNIVRSLLKRNVKVIRVPWDYDYMNSDLKFDGVFLSNGPGDPAVLTNMVDNVKKAMEEGIPVVGICLGNQIIGQAAGAKTFKLKYGHRGQNQPCINTETGKAVLTSQNHGFAIDEKTLPKGWKVWFKNANDDSVEGIKHESKPYACVQFHPEATPGPTDTNYLFDELLSLI